MYKPPYESLILSRLFNERHPRTKRGVFNLHNGLPLSKWKWTGVIQKPAEKLLSYYIVKEIRERASRSHSEEVILCVVQETDDFPVDGKDEVMSRTNGKQVYRVRRCSSGQYEILKAIPIKKTSKIHESTYDTLRLVCGGTTFSWRFEDFEARNGFVLAIMELLDDGVKKQIKKVFTDTTLYDDDLLKSRRHTEAGNRTSSPNFESNLCESISLPINDSLHDDDLIDGSDTDYSCSDCSVFESGDLEQIYEKINIPEAAGVPHHNVIEQLLLFELDQMDNIDEIKATSVDSLSLIESITSRTKISQIYSFEMDTEIKAGFIGMPSIKRQFSSLKHARDNTVELIKCLDYLLELITTPEWVLMYRHDLAFDRSENIPQLCKVSRWLAEFTQRNDMPYEFKDMNCIKECAEIRLAHAEHLSIKFHSYIIGLLDNLALNRFTCNPSTSRKLYLSNSKNHKILGVYLDLFSFLTKINKIKTLNVCMKYIQLSSSEYKAQMKENIDLINEEYNGIQSPPTKPAHPHASSTAMKILMRKKKLRKVGAIDPSTTQDAARSNHALAFPDGERAILDQYYVTRFNELINLLLDAADEEEIFLSNVIYAGVDSTHYPPSDSPIVSTRPSKLSVCTASVITQNQNQKDTNQQTVDQTNVQIKKDIQKIMSPAEDELFSFLYRISEENISISICMLYTANKMKERVSESGNVYKQEFANKYTWNIHHTFNKILNNKFSIASTNQPLKNTFYLPDLVSDFRSNAELLGNKFLLENSETNKFINRFMTLSVKQIVSVLHQLISCEKDELFASALGNKEKMNIVASYFSNTRNVEAAFSSCPLPGFKKYYLEVSLQSNSDMALFVNKIEEKTFGQLAEVARDIVEKEFSENTTPAAIAKFKTIIHTIHKKGVISTLEYIQKSLSKCLADDLNTYVRLAMRINSHLEGVQGVIKSALAIGGISQEHLYFTKLKLSEIF